MAIPFEKNARYTCAAVANALLAIACSQGEALTNLVLQKLVYFAHGWYLGIQGKPLVIERCQAWQYGPVFPELYNALKKYGAGEVKPIESSISVDSDSDDYRFLKTIFRNYGKYTPGQLISITHRSGSPWDQCGAGKTREEIPNEMIKAYYATLVKKNREGRA